MTKFFLVLLKFCRIIPLDIFYQVFETKTRSIVFLGIFSAKRTSLQTTVEVFLVVNFNFFSFLRKPMNFAQTLISVVL